MREINTVKSSEEKSPMKIDSFYGTLATVMGWRLPTGLIGSTSFLLHPKLSNNNKRILNLNKYLNVINEQDVSIKEVNLIKGS